MKYFVANWKANKNLAETKEWFVKFKEKLQSGSKIVQGLQKNECCIVICPPYPLLQAVHEEVSALKLPNISAGAQDVSVFEGGSYTGEVPAKSLEGVAQYVIVGHSERREYAHETDEQLEKKVRNAQIQGIESLLCIRGMQDKVWPDASFVVYEPVHAIGTGNNESLEAVLALYESLNLAEGVKFFYGGSVNSKVITEYLASDKIDGFLVGGASLDPASFIEILMAV